MITFRQPFVGSFPITQRYGEIVEGVTVGGKPHTGIDYGCPEGTEILASSQGTVMFVGTSGTGYGNCIILQHVAERSRKATLYAHLSRIKVTIGQEVEQGAVIGLSGHSGYVVPAGPDGAHLHFEARSDWWDPTTHRDPISFLPMMSVDDFQPQLPAVPAADPEAILTEGIHQVSCGAAFVRDWESLTRAKMVYQGERVYVFGPVKYQNGLPFYYIGGGFCMAAYDTDGTEILQKV